MDRRYGPTAVPTPWPEGRGADAVEVRAKGTSGTLADLAVLARLRLNFVAAFTTVVGFVVGAGTATSRMSDVLGSLGLTVLATMLVASGASALNQVLERRFDRVMERTRDRPVAAGRLTSMAASVMGGLWTAAGLAILGWCVHPTAAVVAAVTWTVYVFVYTPLKRVTTLSVLVGAVSGALPPVIGWCAATGSLAAGAWALFTIVYVWQVPHFLAIAWLYRDDYRRAGFAMLTVADADGESTAKQAVSYSLALLPASLLPAHYGLAGEGYAACAAALGTALIGAAAAFAIARTKTSARALLVVSILYIVLLYGALLLAR